jgi:hypothetical protein
VDSCQRRIDMLNGTWAGKAVAGHEWETYSNLGAPLSLSGESSSKNLSGQKRWG